LSDDDVAIEVLDGAENMLKAKKSSLAKMRHRYLLKKED
jgi:hypothetical protein